MEGVPEELRSSCNGKISGGDSAGSSHHRTSLNRDGNLSGFFLNLSCSFFSFFFFGVESESSLAQSYSG